jgi:predicted nucleic-acid-binding Zn-ribbon protein
MKKNVVHLFANKFLHDDFAACGHVNSNFFPKLEFTKSRSKVTCGNCKRTRLYKSK